MKALLFLFFGLNVFAGDISSSLPVILISPVPLPVKPTDGTNTITVKAGSTAAAAGDTAQVVALSPNSSTPSTTDNVTNGSLATLNAVFNNVTTGLGTCAFSISGTWVGTISFQGSVDKGVTYPFAAEALVIPTGAALSFVSSNAQFKTQVGGYTNFQLKMTTYTSGTANILMDCGSGVTVSHAYSTNAQAFLNTSYTNDGSGNPISSTGGSLDTFLTNTSIPVTQSTSPWVSNITQFGSTNISTGTGTSGIGIPRMTVSNDSKIIAWDGTNTSTVKAASTASEYTDTAVVITDRPDNVGTPTQTSVSCASTSTTLLAANMATMFLLIRNPTTSTVTIWINVAGVAAVVGVPSLDLAPGSEANFFAEGSGFLPTSAVTCISSGAASSVALIYK